MIDEEKELNNTINKIAESMSKQIHQAQINILLRDIIMIYETEITYDEYKKSVEEHNKAAYENNTKSPDGKTLTLSFMPKRELLSKDEFDYIKGLKNTKYLKELKLKCKTTN